jgi:hypothetical protein
MVLLLRVVRLLCLRELVLHLAVVGVYLQLVNFALIDVRLYSN